MSCSVAGKADAKITPVSEASGSGRAHFSGSQPPVVVFL